MSEIGHNVGSQHLRAFIERIERLEEEIKSLNGDKSEVYKEARSMGFDVKTMRKVVAARKLDDADRQEADALFDAYMAALGMLPLAHVHAHVEKIEEFPVPRFHQVDGGRPDPSSDEAPSGDRAAQGRSIATGQSEQQSEDEPQDRNEPVSGEASSAEDFQPPAFLVKKQPLRPHCLNPDLCAGQGYEHCHACKKAMAEGEAD